MKMKTLSSKKILGWTAFTTGVLLAGVAMAQPTPPPTPQVQTRNVVVTTGGSGGEGAVASSGGTGSSGGIGSSRSVIKIESIEPARADEPAREVTWLGLSTEEASEALASQLGLKPGQGLVVVFVAPDSPAAKAGIQKYDVIEEVGDQMLVDPVQLRKLVQMQKEGDTVKLMLYRSGKKQTVPATLAKRAEGLGMLSAEPGMAEELSEVSRGANNGNWIIENRMAPKAYASMNKQMVNAEVQLNMEEARTAIQEALRQSAQADRLARPVAPVAPLPPIPALVDVGNDATVTVTKDGDSVQTIVKSDDTGVLVIVASPKKHLTAHDQAGKLLFDGEIETPEQQQKVPAALWKKVKPMLQQIKPAADGEPQPHAQSGDEPKL
jgi:membrane-associated protease RseP (regulator of RpoE activity)